MWNRTLNSISSTAFRLRSSRNTDAERTCSLEDENRDNFAATVKITPLISPARTRGPYAKELTYYGIRIIGSDMATDEALLEVAYCYSCIARRNPEVLEDLGQWGLEVYVIDQHYLLEDFDLVARYRESSPYESWLHRPFFWCPPRAIVHFEDEVFGLNESGVRCPLNISIQHELAHAIHFCKGMGSPFDQQIRRLFEEYSGTGIWDLPYAFTNHKELWACAVAAFFGTYTDPGLRHYSRSFLQNELPELYAMVTQVFSPDSPRYVPIGSERLEQLASRINSSEENP